MDRAENLGLGRGGRAPHAMRLPFARTQHKGCLFNV